MEELDNIYNELIMEHSMNSYNKKKINDANFEEIGHNPNCGDEITLEVKINNGIIEGKNNLIKVIKRISFGYRKFKHLTTRALLISNTIKG